MKLIIEKEGSEYSEKNQIFKKRIEILGLEYGAEVYTVDEE